MPSVSIRLAWEHTHRELLPAVIFLHQIQKRGVHGCIQHLKSLSSLGPERELILLPFFYDDLDIGRYLKRVDVSNKILVNLAYEQLHLARARDYVMPDGQFAHENLLHCAWGDRFVEMLMRRGIPESRIRVIGHPRFDIYSHRSLLFTREELAAEFGLEADKDWVLVPYNFNMAYVGPGQVKTLNSRGYDVGQDLIDATAQARDAFTEMVTSLATRFPDKEVILRVHPAGYEASTIYAGLKDQHPNLHIISAYDIANWIVQASVVLVWTSTSALEAIVAGVPVVSYEPYPFSERWDYDLNRIIPTYDNVEDILEVVDGLPDKELTYDLELFGAWHAHQDGKNVARQVDLTLEAAEQWDTWHVPGGPTPPGAWVRLKERIRPLLPASMRRPKHAPPPPEALARAVTELDARDLGPYLR